ncbi:SpoIIE family protein phosphatase [Streptomyces sp. NPDC058534]|uniref:SpoIIE family protein phosphatase n=1 Tax=Streptomyces sp. NPDC058534 TaxID=3346541 RepID=UPI003652F786
MHPPSIAPAGPTPVSQPDRCTLRTTLHASQEAACEARFFVRQALAEQIAAVTTGSGNTTEVLNEISWDAELLVSELATNAIMHAGTDIDVICSTEERRPSSPRAQGRSDHSAPADDQHEPVAVIIEVVDRHPARGLRAQEDLSGGRGLGLRIVGALAASWGVTYDHHQKSVWFRLESAGRDQRGTRNATPSPLHTSPDPGTREPVSMAGPEGDTAEWPDRVGPTYLAEASELLAGQLDEDLVAALAGQLLVPRLADWCGVWRALEGRRMWLSQVWHAEEWRIDALRDELAREAPTALISTASIPWPWPETAGVRGSALAFPLVASGACQGILLLGGAGQLHMTDRLENVVRDLARRIAQALVTARRYTRQTTISRALQRGQLPEFLAGVPGVETAIVYEPHGEGQTVGGDFYDLFPMGEGRWGFLLGDVQGKDPEATSVTGLARYLVRALAREGRGVESVLGRLNAAMVEESAEAVAHGGERARPRFFSLLYGELQLGRDDEGPRFTIASAGHPLPLRLQNDGSVMVAAEPQMLLGIDGDAEFDASSFNLAPGETLLCVTDGVTERRSGHRQLDDDDGLAVLLGECSGLGANMVAARIRRSAHDFSPDPVEDDLSILVLHTLAAMNARTDAKEHRPVR